MPTPRELAERFYTAFQTRDAEAMAAVYAPNASFSDPVFPNLHGDEIGGMWSMLCGRADDLRVEFEIRAAEDSTADVRWQAWYTFAATGRKVHNIIDAHLEVEEGLVTRHIDEFDFWRWSRQALGAPGLLLGWSGFLQRKIQARSDKLLRGYMAKKR